MSEKRLVTLRLRAGTLTAVRFLRKRQKMCSRRSLGGTENIGSLTSRTTPAGCGSWAYGDSRKKPGRG
jgi:hypothetical protein